MYVHVPVEVVERYPWLGVLIGAGGLALFGFLTVGMWREQARLGRQGAPERVTPGTARIAAEAPRRWVVLEGGSWDCAHVGQATRRPPDSWLFGRVESTQVPVWDEGRGSLVVVKLDGDVPCATVAGAPVEGVLVRPDDHLWGGSVTPELRALQPPGGVSVLCAGAGPRRAALYTLIGAGLCAASLALTLYFLRRWRARMRPRSTPPAGAPIVPR